MSIAGLWKNEYDSTMQLWTFDNLVYGYYRSHTGSTGTYIVVGYADQADPTASIGEIVSLSIAWHSIDGGAGDASWNWCSGLSGQVSLVNGAPSMVLEHCMVASTPFEGLCDKGNYIDKLTYVRVSDVEGQPPAKPEGSDPGLGDPASGTWVAEDGTRLQLVVDPYPGNLFGYVYGTLEAPSGRTEIIGVTDINAIGSGLPLQSIAITSYNPGGSVATTLAGTLEIAANKMTLIDLESKPTDPKYTFVQTTIASKTFLRQ